ncbi:hypothetical protein HZA57_01745, partial [Candidatus Poribacteria bacterium]|nr:hypothetical protein [Candidatus Poribacteria bacterium]
MQSILRIAFAVLLALVLPAAAPAISILIPDDPAYPPLTIRSQVIDVDIDGPVARTRLEQVFTNPHPRELEGQFLLPLPKGAQITDFVMIINGQEVHAQALEREEAERIYTDIVRRMQDPGLLEYLDGQTFRVRVYPIPASGDLPIQLSFAQPLRREGELMAFDFATGYNFRQTVETETDLAVHLRWGAPLGTIYSPTHTVNVERSKDGDSADVFV